MISPFAVVVGAVFALAIGATLLAVDGRVGIDAPPLLTKKTAFILIIVVAAGAFIAQGIDAGLEHDEGIYAVANIEVANGNLPYTAAFVATGPLGPWYGGLGVAMGRLVGTDAVASARMAYFPLALLAAVATFLLGLRMRLSTFSAAVGALALVAIPSFSREALSGPRPKMLVLALLVLYLIALHDGRYFIGGAVLALATLTWQSSFIFILVPIVVSLWRKPPDRVVRSAMRFIAGGLVMVVVVVGTYSLAGQLDMLVEGFVGWIFGQGTSRLPTSLSDAVLNPLKDLWGAHQVTWPLLVIGAVAILPFTRRLFDTGDSETPGGHLDALDLVTVAFVVFAAWTLIDYQGVVDLFPFLPLVAVGVARVAEHIRLRSTSWSMAFLVMLVVAGGMDLVRTRRTDLPQQRAELAALVGSGCVVSYGDPVALAISGQSNPHRFFFTFPGIDERLGADAEAYIAVLLADRPEYVGGPTDLEEGNLARAVNQLLPLAGYEAVSTEWFEGWLLVDPMEGQRSECSGE